jgi:hypothetical protein
MMRARLATRRNLIDISDVLVRDQVSGQSGLQYLENVCEQTHGTCRQANLQGLDWPAIRVDQHYTGRLVSDLCTVRSVGVFV